MLLGAHVSTAGGLDKAPERGRSIDAEAIQVFTQNQVQWRARRLTLGEARGFRDAMESGGVRAVVAHGSYLINLASPDRDLRDKSRRAFVQELRRCDALGIRALIFHPGAHMGAGPERGLEAVARSLNHAMRRTRGTFPRILLENTAGAGSTLGRTFEELRFVIERLDEPERVGVCIDTCHLYAAGYDIRSAGGYAETMRSLEEELGLERVQAFHLNDAKRELGSRADRHEGIGAGTIGREAFRRLVRDRRFAGRPAILETPSGMQGWKRELRLLRRLGRPARRRVNRG